MGYLQSKLVADLLCHPPGVNQLVRPARIPPRQSEAARPCSTPPGGARQGPISGYVLQSVSSAGRAESLGLQGRIIIASSKFSQYLSCIYPQHLNSPGAGCLTYMHMCMCMHMHMCRPSHLCVCRVGTLRRVNTTLGTVTRDSYYPALVH